MPARSALRLTLRSNLPAIISRSLSVTALSAVAEVVVAAGAVTVGSVLDGSAAGAAAFCLGASLAIAVGAAWLGVPSMSFAVSGGSREVSGMGTAVSICFSDCWAMPA